MPGSIAGHGTNQFINQSINEHSSPILETQQGSQ